jgi:hypothetical protein
MAMVQRSKQMPAHKRDQFNMRVKPEFMAAIDDWRSRQRPIPTVSEAIVTLCLRAIEADVKDLKSSSG